MHACRVLSKVEVLVVLKTHEIVHLRFSFFSVICKQFVGSQPGIISFINCKECRKLLGNKHKLMV